MTTSTSMSLQSQAENEFHLPRLLLGEQDHASMAYDAVSMSIL